MTAADTAGPHILLVGLGHAHLEVVRRADELHARGARVTVVTPGDAYYSGMATGVLSGRLAPAEGCIEAAALCARHGVRLLRARVVGMDRDGRRLRLEDGNELPWDLLSLNVGSVVPTWAIPGAAEHAVTAKPIAGLLALGEALDAAGGGATRSKPQGRTNEKPDTEPVAQRIVVVGGGATGAEVAAALAARAARSGARAEVTLLGRSARLLPEAPRGAGRAVARSLARHGITVINGCTVTRIEAGAVVSADGRRFPAEQIVLATGLAPPRWLADWGLPLGPRGGLLVDASLSSPADPSIFAGGDCAELKGHDLPRLGVFGVRQAPVLVDNLAAALEGRPLRSYEPQRRWLAILHLGEHEGLATRGALWWRGRSSLWLKDRIDRRWMARYVPRG